MTVNQAVRALRRSRGESQQAFATRLGLSISTIGNYERKRHPDTRSLIRLSLAAREAGREDLVAVFSKAMDDLGEELGIASIRDIALQETIGKELAAHSDLLWLEQEFEKMVEREKQRKDGSAAEIKRLVGLLEEYRNSISRVVVSGPKLNTHIDTPGFRSRG